MSPLPFYRPYAPAQGAAPFYSLPYATPMYPNTMYYPGFAQPPNQFSPYGNFPLVGQSFYGNRASVSLLYLFELNIYSLPTERYGS